MTTFLCDKSHYDSDGSIPAGFAGGTHKITEGTDYVDPMAGARLNAWHAAGVPAIGSYHVLRTGNLSAQLAHWVGTLDSLVPWWRTFPHWIMQVDAEKWPYDPVTLASGRTYTGPLHLASTPLHHDPLEHARLYRELLARRVSTTMAFAAGLVGSGLPGWKITYASRGQYGDSLTGIATPLWNAAYHGSAYPGDGAADWRTYSAQAPTLWQYTSTPYDKNAFRGTQDQLMALIQGARQVEQTDRVQGNLAIDNTVGNVLADTDNKRCWEYDVPGQPGRSKNPPPAGSRLDIIFQAAQKILTGTQVVLSDADRAAIVAGVTTALGAGVELAPDVLVKVQAALHTELAKVQLSIA